MSTAHEQALEEYKGWLPELIGERPVNEILITPTNIGFSLDAIDHAFEQLSTIHNHHYTKYVLRAKKHLEHTSQAMLVNHQTGTINAEAILATGEIHAFKARIPSPADMGFYAILETYAFPYRNSVIFFTAMEYYSNHEGKALVYFAEKSGVYGIDRNVQNRIDDIMVKDETPEPEEPYTLKQRFDIYANYVNQVQ